MILQDFFLFAIILKSLKTSSAVMLAQVANVFNKTKQSKVVVDTSQPISIQPKNQIDLDVLIKLDLIDSEDMKEVSEFLDKLLAQEKYEGRRESNVKYVVE